MHSSIRTVPWTENINDATFGHVLKAASPRIGQLALKLTF